MISEKMTCSACSEIGKKGARRVQRTRDLSFFIKECEYENGSEIAATAIKIAIFLQW